MLQVRVVITFESPEEEMGYLRAIFDSEISDEEHTLIIGGRAERPMLRVLGEYLRASYFGFDSAELEEMQTCPVCQREGIIVDPESEWANLGESEDFGDNSL